MELTPYLETLHRDLSAAAGSELLGTVIETSGRLCLLEALSDATAEITARLPSGSVELRLRGRDVQFVVSEAAPPPAPAVPTGSPEPEGDITRITLRLPETLKDAIETAAAAGSVSVNAWLVRAIAAAVANPPGATPTRDTGRRYTGYAQA
jgi:hypothetical protein